MPHSRPTAYASVDLCEVVRQTSYTLRTVEGEVVDPIECIHHYAEGMQGVTPDDITPVVQTLMANGHIPPVEGIGRIREIMHGWKAAGVYIVANTSTLPGCEIGTIRFFEQHLPGVFDGILLPRNHDGSHPVTKGVAARNMLEFFNEGSGEPTAVIHIDDLAHHNAGFRAAVGGLAGIEVQTFQPMYPSHFEHDPHSNLADNPQHAFEIANVYLQEFFAKTYGS